LLRVIAAIILLIYRIIEKQEQRYLDFMASVERKDISKKIEELKEKDKKSLFTETDYFRYIVYQLEQVNLSLMRQEGKNMREWMTTYYKEVGKIPSYPEIQKL